jgi:hypothetical protein
MKKILLILLPISIFLVSCGGGEEAKTIEVNKLNKSVQFVISDEFEPVDNETYINAFMQSVSFMNMSEQKRISLIKNNRENINMYVKKETQDYVENMIIKKIDSMPSKELLNKLVEELQGNSLLDEIEGDSYVEEISPIKLKLIRSGNKKYKNKYDFFEIATKNGISEEVKNSFYTSMYSINIDNNYYQIFLNTNSRAKIEDVILNITIQ